MPMDTATNTTGPPIVVSGDNPLLFGTSETRSAAITRTRPRPPG